MPEKYMHALSMIGLFAKDVKGAIVDKEMIRGLFIAFIAGGIVLYGTVQTLGTRLDNVEGSVDRYETQVMALETSEAVSQVKLGHFEKELDKMKIKIDQIHSILIEHSK